MKKPKDMTFNELRNRLVESAKRVSRFSTSDTDVEYNRAMEDYAKYRKELVRRKLFHLFA